VFRQVLWCALLALGIGCSSGPDTSATDAPPVVEGGQLPPGAIQVGSLTLSTRAGVFTADGREGLALLVLLRDGAGHGPASPWSLVLRGPGQEELKRLIYDDASDASFMAFWWADLAPEPGTYTLEALGEQARGTVRFEIAGRTGLGAPAPVLATEGGALTWSPVDGASVYRCVFSRDGARVASTSLSAEPRCDPGVLGAGLYAATVEAFSVDLSSLGTQPGPSPTLPDAFHLASAQLGFARGEAGTTLQLRAAVGRLAYGPVSGGTLLWAALTDGQGQPPAQDFVVQLSGPGIPSGAPLRLTYPAGEAQVVWPLYELVQRAGTYGIRASAATSTVATSFVAGDGADLPIAGDVAATAGGSGADVTWSPVAGAVSYRVVVWEDGAQTPAAMVVVKGPRASFAWSAFTSGRNYQAYVLATDVDLTAAGLVAGRSQVRASENAYSPARFTAR
jgi:hypothetical protein